ncbi:vacuolar import and degradation protein-domain-containing protein [Gongronella butleri]|nr:vacuolar import and degradation protein-domain-containing protein [Gongronella butleri]
MPIPSISKPSSTPDSCFNKASISTDHPDHPETPSSLASDSQTSQPTKQQPRSLLRTRRKDDDATDLSIKRIRNGRFGALYAGSTFVGSQKCNDKEYDVVVDILNVNTEESTISGYLNIKGLTDAFPELTTYFEGEIIGPKYSFLTRKWQAQHYIDVCHWSRFPSFEKYIPVFNKDGFTYDPTNEDCVYMRWKEKFLVPDHHISSIDGASFAGFYYVCFNRSDNTICGMYFYRHFTQWYQELLLRHQDDNQRAFASYEFR